MICHGRVTSSIKRKRTAARSANLVGVHTDPTIYGVLLTTLLFSSATVAVTLLFAVPLSWLLMRTDTAFKGTGVTVLLVVGLLVPVFLRTIGLPHLLVQLS